MFFRMVYKSGPTFLPFCHKARVWQTDRQTDRRTDGQTDRILIARPRLHCMQRGKNYKILLQSNPLYITSLYTTLRFMSQNSYPRPALTEYNPATLRIISLRTMSQIG